MQKSPMALHRIGNETHLHRAVGITIDSRQIEPHLAHPMSSSHIGTCGMEQCPLFLWRQGILGSSQPVGTARFDLHDMQFALLAGHDVQLVTTATPIRRKQFVSLATQKIGSSLLSHSTGFGIRHCAFVVFRTSASASRPNGRVCFASSNRRCKSPSFAVIRPSAIQRLRNSLIDQQL